MSNAFPILYSFRRCPYAMRARLALYESGIRCELREVVLRDKPPSMLALSPKGTVPVLQTVDGGVIEESLEIMLWALSQSDPGGWLNADRSQTMSLVQQNDTEFKTALDRYKYATRYEDADPLQEREKAENFLRVLEGHLQETSQLLSHKPTLADFAMFPFIRQFAFTDKAWFDKAPYPAIHKWLDGHISSGLFQNVMPKFNQWREGDAPILFGKIKSRP